MDAKTDLNEGDNTTKFAYFATVVSLFCIILLSFMLPFLYYKLSDAQVELSERSKTFKVADEVL